MDQSQYDRLLRNLRAGKPTPESENYVFKDGKLYYTVLTDKHVRKELQVVTESQKIKHLKDCHSGSFGHYNASKTRKNFDKLSEQYYWPGMLEDVEMFRQSCDQCQKANRSAAASSPPLREQGARKLSALGREATPPRSPTPDQTSQSQLDQSKTGLKSFGTGLVNFVSGLNPWRKGSQADIQPTATSGTPRVENIKDVGPKLCALCTIGDEDAVRRLLDDSDTDVNQADSAGETPLHKACHAGKLHIMTLLLRQVGIDISKKSNNGQTPLHIASKLGNMEAARLLLNAESDERNATSYVNSLDKQGLTSLCYLAKFSKDIKVVTFLRQRGADLGFSLKSAAACTDWETKDAENLINLCGGLYQNWDLLFEVIRSEGGSRYCSITDENSNTLLHLALLHGQTEHAKDIIQRCKGVIDAKNEEFKTPLHLAIEVGNIEIVDILLDCNAEITCVKGSEMTPLHIAVKQTSAEYPIEQVVEALLARQTADVRDAKMQTPLHYAAKYCNDYPRVTTLLLGSGAELDVQDKDGLTPLLLAAKNGCESTFDVMVQTKKGIGIVKQTLLDLARGQPQLSTHQNSELLNILLAMPKAVEYLSCTDDLGNTPLHIAAKHNCIGAVRLLLTKGADCNCKNHMGRTPLHLASASGSMETVQVLTNNSMCDLMSEDNQKMTPLHMAAEQSNVNILKLLLEKNVDCNIGNSSGRTPLHLAATMGYEKNVQVLLGKDNCKVSSEDNGGMTPLHIACQNGHTKIAELLLGKGAEVDHKNAQGNTPLNLAVKARRKETVRLLLSNGASFLSSFSAARNQEKATMIEMCGKLEVKKTIFKAVKVETHESLEFLKLLTNSTENLLCHSTDPQTGNTPLHVAASVGNVQAVDLLLHTEQATTHQGQKKCVGKENKEKKTPLHMAAEKGHVKVVKKLISYKNIGVEFKSGKLTPMHLACQNDQLEVVETIATMVPQWINSSDEDNDMKTPLHIASEKGNMEIVSALVKHSAKPQPTRNGTTPIHIAVKNRGTEVVKILLSAYPDEVDTANNKGQTPLHHAACYCGDHPKMITTLIERGAKLDAQDKDGLTPLLLAAMNKCESTFNVMVQTENGIGVVKQTLLDLARGQPEHASHKTTEHLKVLLTMPKAVEYISCTDEYGNTPLHIAAKRNCDGAVRVLLTMGADCNIKNREEKTSLHLASACGCNRTVQVLMNNENCDLMSEDNQQMTPLHMAAEQSNVNILKLLLEKYVDCNIGNISGRTPLHFAATVGYEKNVQVLLGKDNCNVSCEDKDGMTPLHIACQSGHTEVAKLLLDRGADIDHKNAQGSTPLNLAIRARRKATVSLLLLNGASFLRSFISAAKQQEETTMIETCGDAEVKKAVSEAVKVERDECLEFLNLLSNSAGNNFCHNCTDPQSGNTPLHLAASVGNVQAVVLILHTEQATTHQDQVTCLEKENSEKKTPLHMASENGHVEVVKKLISYNTDNRVENKSGKLTPMHLACQNDQLEVVETIATMIPQWINSSDEDNDMQTPLHVASEKGNMEIVSALVKHNAELRPTRNGTTPIHITVKNKNIEGLKILLSAYPDEINTADNKQQTPLHHAALHCGDHPEIITTLIESGADVGAQDRKKYTPLMVAAAFRTDAAWKSDALFRKMIEKDCAGVEKSLFLATRLLDPTRLNVIKLILSTPSGRRLCSESKDEEGNTLLHIATSAGIIGIVELMLKWKDEVKCDVKNGEGKTPMHLAAKNGHHEIVKLLISWDVRVVHVQDNWGHTPLACAAVSNQEMVIQLLLPSSSLRKSASALEQNGEVVSKLFTACSDGQMKKELISAVLQCDVNFIQILADQTGIKYLAEPVDPVNNTPLHLAATYGHHEVVKMLLEVKPKPNQRRNILSRWVYGEKGIQVNAENIHHETPLHLAAKNGPLQEFGCEHSHKDVISILLDHGAKISSTKEEGCTPIHIAVMKEFTEGVKVLLEKRPKCVNYTDKQQHTPLHYAGKHCHKAEIIAILIEGKGDLGALDKNGLTPILTAAVYKNDDAFNTMVEKGGDSLKSTLFQAAKKPDTSNFQALERISKVCGFSVCYHSRDEHDNTPVHTSARYGNLTALQVFLDWQHRDQWEEKVELICNNEGRTPAHLALEFDHFSILEALIKHNHNTLMVNDGSGRTVLHLACRNGQLKAVQMIEIHLDSEKLQEIYEICDNKGNTPLHLACQSQKEIVVLHLVDKRRASVDTRNKLNGEAPIHVAAQGKSIKIVDILLEQGANIESRDTSGCTPLHHAARCDQNAMIQHLAKRHGANLNAENKVHIIPLVMAAQNKCTGAFRYLMQLMDQPIKTLFKMMDLKVINGQTVTFMLKDSSWGRTIRDARNDCNSTLLHVAALRGNTEAVLALVDQGVPATSKNDESKTPMHLAAANGHASIVKEMISRKTSLAKEADKEGMTPLHYACQQGHFNVVKAHKSLLEEKEIRDAENSDFDTPLHLSCESLNVQIVCFLISKGANINAKNKKLLTPLHIVTQHGHVDIAKMLLQERAHVNCRDNRGYTPLHYAAKVNSTELVHLLCKKDANLSKEDFNSFTPLLTAAAHKQTKAFQCLMQYVDLSSKTENPAFKVLSIANFNSEILQFLLDDCNHGETLCHATDTTGHTPLHIACECGNLEAVKLLLDHGARDNAQNRDFETPMHLAAGKGLENVVQHLIGHNPQLMLCKDSGGRTPLHTASQHGQTDVVKIYIQNLRAVPDTNLL